MHKYSQHTCKDCLWLEPRFRRRSWTTRPLGCRHENVDENSPACRRYRPVGCELTKLQLAADKLKDTELYDWLPKDFNKAFVICLGAGPWKFERRKKVQGAAIEWLGARDISELKDLPFDQFPYPLFWQNSKLRFLAKELSLQFSYKDGQPGDPPKMGQTFTEFCEYLLEHAKTDPMLALHMLGSACGNAEYRTMPKVISLFARDALKIPCFPIDRHVRRYLKEHKLPDYEDPLVYLCQQAGYDPRRVATGMVKTGIDKGNPDWRHLDE